MAIVLPNPCLCLVTDRHVGDESTLVERVAQAVAGGVDLVQLREKDLHGAQLLDLAQRLRRAIDDRALLVINERVDVAATLPADGAQLGEDAVPVPAARRILGPDLLIGRSVHSVAGAKTGCPGRRRLPGGGHNVPQPVSSRRGTGRTTIGRTVNSRELFVAGHWHRRNHV